MDYPECNAFAEFLKNIFEAENARFVKRYQEMSRKKAINTINENPQLLWLDVRKVRGEKGGGKGHSHWGLCAAKIKVMRRD